MNSHQRSTAKHELPRAVDTWQCSTGQATWQCSTGQAALRRLLSSPSNIDLGYLPIEDFTVWVRDFIQRQRDTCPIFRKRERIRDLFSTHWEAIAKLKGSKNRCLAAYQALPCFPEWETLLESSRKLQLASDGLTAFLQNTQCVPPHRIQKVSSAKQRLEQVTLAQAAADERLSQLGSTHVERQAYEDAEAQLEEFLVGIGVRKEERELEELQRAAAQAARGRGTEFEAAATHVLREAFAGGGGGLPLSAQNQHRKGSPTAHCSAAPPASCPPPLAHLLPKDSEGLLFCILSNVTLGIAKGEMDKVLVSLKPSQAQTPQRPATGTPAPQHILVPDQLLVAEGQNKSFRVHRVLAVVECKRNCEDLGYSFLHYQDMLAWLTGDKGSYSAQHMKTKAHSSGHFKKPTVHSESGAEFLFPPGSFSLFQRDERSGYFLQGLVLLTCLRPGGISLTGIDSQAMAKLKFRLSSSHIPLFLCAPRKNESSAPLAEASKLQAWLAGRRQAGMSAAHVLELYAARAELASNVLLLEETALDTQNSSGHSGSNLVA